MSEHRQQCAVLQEKLQEMDDGQHELQSRLNAATSAAADARKQRDEAMQALQAAQEQFASLDVSHKVGWFDCRTACSDVLNMINNKQSAMLAITSSTSNINHHVLSYFCAQQYTA